MIASYCKLKGEKKKKKKKKRKRKDDVFTSWNNYRDSSTEQPNQNLDYVLTDSSVIEVLRSYFIPKYIARSDFYNYTKSNKIDEFFSRNKNDKYLPYAIAECGFPDDSV